MDEEELLDSLEFTPTWVVAVVCFVIVSISLCVERSLHKLGKYLHREHHDALHEALEKLKGELMLLGFISLLLTVFQNAISQVCIPYHISYNMLPCERPNAERIHHGRHLLSSAGGSHCGKGKAPLLSLEALHHLHIFIFVLAVVHVIFCVTTMVLGGAKVRRWKHWEDSIVENLKNVSSQPGSVRSRSRSHLYHLDFFQRHTEGYWRKASLISWMIAFFKQFHGSVTKSDYVALRQGFMKKHFPNYPEFNFHNYMLRTLEVDFRKIVGISWYLWLFVVLFLLLNLDGWHTYFWLSFLPLILLLLVGAKLEHIITRLAQENEIKKPEDQESQQQAGKKADETPTPRVKPSNKYFWFKKPGIVLILIHFILFQNSFEIAFFFWIWSTYGFQSCIMDKVGYIIPRLFIGVIVQLLCSYSTLPLYVIVTQMGSSFKEGMFDNLDPISGWFRDARSRNQRSVQDNASSMAEKPAQIQKMNTELSEIVQVSEQPEILATEATTASVTDHGDHVSAANLH